MHLTVNEYFLTRKMRISISHEQQGSEAVTSWALLLQMKYIYSIYRVFLLTGPSQKVPVSK